MAIPSKKVRDSSSIPTMSGRTSQGEEPYKLFMRITCLEMEKARRGKERESAMARVQQIDSRIEDIEVEKKELVRRTARYTPEASCRGRPARRNAEMPDADRAPFKLRY